MVRNLLRSTLVLALLLPIDGAVAATLRILHSFQGGNDGANPVASLIQDDAGNLYGTTDSGGGTNCNVGCGTVFKVAPDGTETVLYSFAGGSDGEGPDAGLLKDAADNLYGTTTYGGSYGEGTVFKLASTGAESVLYSFHGGSDGARPLARLIKDKAGNLYSTTASGGDNDYGVVFRLAPDGTETELYAFRGGKKDGWAPFAGLIKDAAGNLDSTTYEGGATRSFGTVFSLATNGTETVLHSFHKTDGANPAGGLLKDAAGNLYGMTSAGGDNNRGTIFKLSPDGTETVIHSFAGNGDGAFPQAGLIADKKGNSYGTTYGGGTGCNGGGCGIIFKLSPDGTVSVLYAFTGGNDGAHPFADLFKDSAGNLYGTTKEGGGMGCYGNSGCGTVFFLKQ